MHEIGINCNSLAFRREAKAGDTHLIAISAEFLFKEGITQDEITEEECVDKEWDPWLRFYEGL